MGELVEQWLVDGRDQPRGGGSDLGEVVRPHRRGRPHVALELADETEERVVEYASEGLDDQHPAPRGRVTRRLGGPRGHERDSRAPADKGPVRSFARFIRKVEPK